MVSHVQVSIWQGKKNASIREKKENGKSIGNKESMTFH